MTTEIILAILVAVALQTSIMLVYFLYRSSEQRERRLFSMLSEIRYRGESDVNSINKRMTDTLARWNDINHLQKDAINVYGSTFESPRKMQIPRIYEDLGLSPQDLRIDDRMVLVLMPFHPEFDIIFTRIREVCQEFGLLAVRTDEERAPGSILRHVFESIARARLLIAVLDGRNPNVFYEMGIAQAMDKPVIPIAHMSNEQPFDIAQTRILFYDSVDELRKNLGSYLGTSLARTPSR